ncbi:MAG TPA: L-threonylcarbamoyladenylate synthase [Streptosporangiaceae bacterium]|nr:L-threonylcarbamoyladenylate synthase [Streptosporangiaceae bacterium]
MTKFNYVRLNSASRLVRLADAGVIADSLRQGSIAVLPTETGYMIAAMATSLTAVDRVFAVKGRQESNVMHVACASLRMAQEAGVLTPRALRLLGTLTPGPVTVIVEKTPLLPDRLVTLNGTVGIRVPDHPATLQIIGEVGAPLTATSLNASGRAPAALKDLDLGKLNWPNGETIHVIEDDDAIVYKSPSTLVRVLGEDTEILRTGPISEHEVRKLTGPQRSRMPVRGV